ncbi:hypothetical protein GCM10009733_023060 [Nonomuraea maheshkhaliensis]|uniref:Uncharacterized protein n=1 Tax=Nonomuraea maheshkhaliensis TaxID=419590 RepID=A0ABN2F144_9ACTN
MNPARAEFRSVHSADAQLLEGAAWEAVKDSVLTDLGLPEEGSGSNRG